MKNKKKYLLIILAFLCAYFMPFESFGFKGPLMESLLMLQDYARHHMLFSLVPAFFIAGAIAEFIKQRSIVKYFGAKANKFLSYTVASVSGVILTACSCTVLPMFTGIYKKGAGIGPAIAFLYSGPAINVLAIILSLRVLGIEIGIARAAGAVIFAVIIGLIMHFVFYSEEKDIKQREDIFMKRDEEEHKPLWKILMFFGVLIGILVFAGFSSDDSVEVWKKIYEIKWYAVSVFLILLGALLYLWFNKEEIKIWFMESMKFVRQIVPLLFIGIIIAGFFLGRPGHDGLIPAGWVASMVGGNSFRANFFASLAGALMYFCTLIEIPIVHGLIGAGMGKGPALALLLAGPALSLPNMLVTRSIIGTRKTFVYISLVVILATLSGMAFGYLF